eukprot:3780483-Rhodomonas_salina.1
MESETTERTSSLLMPCSSSSSLADELSHPATSALRRGGALVKRARGAVEKRGSWGREEGMMWFVAVLRGRSWWLRGEGLEFGDEGLEVGGGLPVLH